MNKIKYIYSIIKPYKRITIPIVIFNLLGIIFSLSSLGLAIPFLNVLFDKQPIVTEVPDFKFNLDTIQIYINYYLSQVIIEKGKQNALLLISLLVVATSLLRNLFIYISNYFLAYLRNHVVKDIRDGIYYKVVDLPIGYFSDKRKGDIMTRMTSDIQEIEFSAVNSLLVLIREPIKIIIYLGSLFIMSVQLSLFVLVLLPISGYLIGRIGKKIKNIGNIGQTQMGILISNIEETLFGLRIIKAFGAEKIAKERFGKVNNNFANIITGLQRRRDMGSPVSEFLGTIVMMIIMFYGGTLILSGNSVLDPVGFITYLLIFSQVISPSKALTTASYNLKKGAASMDRVNEIIYAENKIVEVENAHKIKGFQEGIEYKNVYFRYNDQWVLQDINLSISKGKMIAIVGESGSGKSTLVDLIPRFYDIQKGEILIDGVPVHHLNIESLRKLIGFVNQEPILFNDTIFNNIAFGLENASEEDVIAAAKVANAHEFIAQTPDGYQTVIGDRGTKLSGGQRQRLSIARAVLKNPPILILDEATSALDTESEKLVQDALINLMKNRTSIVIAHRLSTVRDADEIVVLQEGRIIEHGNHHQLLAVNGAYKRFHELQMY